MPRARVEPIEEYLLDIEEAGMELPDGLSPEQAYRLAAAVAFLVRRRKPVRILGPDHVVCEDAKMVVDVPLRPARRAADLAGLLADEAEPARGRDRRTVLWIDAARAADPDFAFDHALFGEVTLYAYPTKPRRPTDERVLASERKGWGSVLKKANLLPARGIVVEDGKHGLLVTSDDARAFAGFLVHQPDGEVAWWPNPFVEARFDDPEFQYWLAWGPGEGPTEWRTVVEKLEDAE